MGTIGQLLEIKGREIWSVEPNATTYESLQLLAEKNIGALLVIKEGKLVGIFSERDFARNSIIKGRSCISSNIEDLMTKKVFYVSPEDTYEDCMAQMTEKHIRHLPVLDNGRVIGMISLADVVKEIISAQKGEIHELKKILSSGETT